MSSKVITATVDGIRSLQDRSLKITLTTQELTPSECGDLFAFQGRYCKVLITDNKVINPDIKAVVEEMEVEEWEKKKSPGSRLRAVLFLNWQKNAEGHEKFDTYYNGKMESMITHYKSKLD